MHKRIIVLIGAALAAGLLWAQPAHAQGCGPQNPNCIVPTAPAGTSTNQAASTKFVQTAIGTNNAITALTGDGTATGPGSVALTLKTVNANVGTFGSATQCAVLTVNAKGLVTAASQTTCTPSLANITGLGTGVATALGNALNASGGLVGFTGAFGNIAPTPVRAGDVIYWNGSTWVTLAGNNSGSNCLTENSSGVPSWTACSASLSITPPQGRLTLLSNTPVMATSQATKTSLLYDCYEGNQVPYYNGSTDLIDTITSCEVSDAMVSAASAGQVVASNVYDVWWVHGGTNRICLAMSAAVGGGGGWSSDTTGSNTARGTGYSQLDRSTRPYTTNKNSIANCFNGATNYGPVSANQGTYLGTVYAIANGQISYVFGTAASGGGSSVLGVWNMYNRVTVPSTVTDNGALYTYTTATTRQARASAGNQIQFVSGIAEDGVQANYTFEGFGAAAVSATNISGIGLDSTTTFATTPCKHTSETTTQASFTYSCPLSTSPQVGFHTISANELGDGTNANTFDGTSLNQLAASLRM